MTDPTLLRIATHHAGILEDQNLLRIVNTDNSWDICDLLDDICSSGKAG